MKLPAGLTELLQDLVAIPSVNPDGDPGTDQTGEQALAEYVADFLRTVGAEVEIVPVHPGRPNVVAHFPIDGTPEARMGFAPHLDTVSVGGMTIEPFDPVIKDGRLYGRGATDTKGPMAAALWAVKDWAQSPERLQSRVEWSYYALMGEEAGNDGALSLAATNFKSDLVLVLEPTELGVITAHKGVLWLEVITKGVACHGSTPDKGVNAILAMGRVIQVLESKVIPALKERVDPRLGHTTLNVGMIKGGRKVNIVPDHCRLELDCRYLPADTMYVLWELVREHIAAAVPDAEVNLMRGYSPLHTDERAPWVAKLGELSRDAGQGFAIAPWFSDAAILGAANRPAVCIGPGRTGEIHTKDEFIRLADLESGFEFFKKWMLTA